MISRLAYRTRQFWDALLSPYKRVPGNILQDHLTPDQLELFQRMQPAEQAHAYQVLQRLQAGGQTDPDLLVAALLHDVGKIQHPLSIIDRVIIVLGKRFFPEAARRWAAGTPGGLRVPFVVAAKHAGWGADLAFQAGASSRSVEMICHHHDGRLLDHGSHTERLLAALRAADDEN